MQNTFPQSIFTIITSKRCLSLRPGYVHHRGFCSPSLADGGLYNGDWCSRGRESGSGQVVTCPPPPVALRGQPVPAGSDRSDPELTLTGRAGRRVFIYCGATPSINPRLTGGGYFEPPPPSRFSAIAAKLLDESSRNFQYLQMHHFYTLCAKKNRTYDRSAVNDVRVTSCLADFDAK